MILQTEEGITEKELKNMFIFMLKLAFLFLIRDFIRFSSNSFQIIPIFLLNIGIIWFFVPIKKDYLNSLFAFLISNIVGIGFNLAQISVIDGMIIIFVSMCIIAIYFKFKEKIYFHPWPLLLLFIEILIIKILFDPKISVLVNEFISAIFLVILMIRAFKYKKVQQPLDNPI